MRPELSQTSPLEPGTGYCRSDRHPSSVHFIADLTETTDVHAIEAVRGALTRRHCAASSEELFDDGALGGSDLATARGSPHAILGEVDLPPRYQPISLLGKGGQGSVYLATDRDLGRQVALKLCRSAASMAIERFTAEALTTASLEHPGICPIHDVGSRFMVMKCLGGDTLLDLIERSHPHPDLPKLVEALVQVCHVVEYVHTRGLMHRDLKAENILLGRHGEVVVIDWGLAAGLVDGHLPESWHGVMVSPCAGTPACLPPEIAQGNRMQVGLAADVWALGGVLYHILSGRMPYEEYHGMDDVLRAAAANQWQSVKLINPHAPGELVALQQSAMDRNPAHRPCVSELRLGLRRWLLQSGNVAAAGHALELARLLERRADVCGPAERENRIDCYAQALNQYDRVMALVPDDLVAKAERAALLQRYITWLMNIGEFMLARFLLRNRGQNSGIHGSGNRQTLDRYGPAEGG